MKFVFIINNIVIFVTQTRSFLLCNLLCHLFELKFFFFKFDILIDAELSLAIKDHIHKKNNNNFNSFNYDSLLCQQNYQLGF